MLDDLIGKPFKDGGRGPDVFDCYGLAKEVFQRFGVMVPNYIISAESTLEIDALARIHEGWNDAGRPLPIPCLITMRFNSPIYVNHVGIYIGNGRFIHTSQKIGVHIERMDHPYWKNHIVGLYIPEEGFNERG